MGGIKDDNFAFPSLSRGENLVKTIVGADRSRIPRRHKFWQIRFQTREGISACQEPIAFEWQRYQMEALCRIEFDSADEYCNVHASLEVPLTNCQAFCMLQQQLTSCR